jgi:uracil-DNA glycosylase
MSRFNLLSVAVTRRSVPARELAALCGDVVACRACERLVDWREQVARDKRAAYADETYWGRPIPGFGDPAATVVVLGLAPAAHGANRTGRVFTGDRSGDWLFRAMYRAGFANQPMSTSADDGLTLRGAWVTAAVKCAPPANRPTPDERDACAPFLAREFAALTAARVVVCLGQFGYDAACRHFAVRPRPRFGHGVEVAVAGGSTANELRLLCSFHPSQQNTFTGRLTEPMLDAVFARARELASVG